MVLPYEIVFSRARGRITDPKELSLNESDLNEIYTERLHNVVGKPRVRRLFSSIQLDDEIQRIEFELNYSLDEYSDKDFVCDVFILGMVIEWLQPQVHSILHTNAAIGTDKEKKIIDNHKNMTDQLAEMKKEQNRMISDYGYMYNSYIKSGS